MSAPHLRNQPGPPGPTGPSTSDPHNSRCNFFRALHTLATPRKTKKLEVAEPMGIADTGKFHVTL